MSELWIRFADAEFDAFDWWRFDADDRQPSASGQGQGDALSRLEAASTCRVFVPQTLLLTLVAQLPPRASRQQLQAIGYAIEDLLANDVEDNHYAIGTQQEDGRLPVIVIERAIMDRLLERLRSSRLRCDAIHPEMLLCPEPEEGSRAALCTAPGGWLLRLSANEALSMPQDLLRDGLDWLAAGAKESLHLDCCRETGPDLPGIDCRPVDCAPDRDRINGGINLLQGDYRPGSRWRERLKPWRPVVILLLGVLLLWLASTVVDRWQQQRRLEQLQAEQWALIDQYLPETPHRGNPRRLLIQRLGALREQAATTGPIELLSDFAELKRGFPGLQIGRVLYRKGELVIDLEGPQLKLFEDLERQLKQRQVAYRIENLDIGPKKTRARLILGGAG